MNGRPAATALYILAALCTAASGPRSAAAQTDPGPSAAFMVFGDATYLWTERDVDGGLSLGQVVGHLTAPLSERFSVASEATITSRAVGPLVTLERLILRYAFSDRLKLSAGRYHTPLSWWNTQYHHGLWLQTSIDRPRMVRFGTPLFPVHFLGLLAEGTVPVGPATVVYEAGFGNGRQPDLSGAGDAGDANSTGAFVGGLRVRPAAMVGLEVGAHVYVDEVDVGAGEVDERIFGGHVAWLGNPEVVGEYLHFVHDPEAAGVGATDSDAYYAQVGWRPERAPTWQPYVRWERVDVGALDPLFTGLGLDYDGWIVGTRWDFTEYAALKAELRSEEFAGAERAASLVLNASFVIPNLIE